MTQNLPGQLDAAMAALSARFASTQLFVSKVDFGPYLNQARSVPWGGVAMALGSSFQRLVS